MGGGTLILTGENTFSGGTAVNDGKLQIGFGGTTGSIAGNIVDNAILKFLRSNDVTFRGDISGSGSLVQAGAGSLTLTGQVTNTGGIVDTGGPVHFGG